jgi:hypothetical protein
MQTQSTLLAKSVPSQKTSKVVTGYAFPHATHSRMLRVPACYEQPEDRDRTPW